MSPGNYECRPGGSCPCCNEPEWRCMNCGRKIEDVGDGEARDVCGEDWCEECAKEREEDDG